MRNTLLPKVSGTTKSHSQTSFRGYLLHISRQSTINSLRPSDAYMLQKTSHHRFRQWLVACPSPSHYLIKCWNIVNWTLWNKLQWNLNRNIYILVKENAFENVVWRMATILSLPQCVETYNQGSDWLLVGLGPFSITTFTNSNSIEMLYCSHLCSHKVIAIIFYMTRQFCCRGMCKYLLWYDTQ